MFGILLLSLFVFFKLPTRPFSSTVFIGDSHFNKEYMSPDNLAMGSEGTIFSYYKLNQITKQQKLDTVYLAFGYHSISDYFLEYDEKTIIVERYFPYLPFSEKINLAFELNYPRMITMFGRQYINRRNPIPGGFEMPPSNSFNVNKCRERTKYIFENRAFYQKNMAGLDSIKSVCNRNNIVLFLVNTPLHPKFRKAIPERYVDKYNQITQHDQLINLENVFLEDDYFLPDGDHLSRKGVKHFTELMNSIRANGGKYSAQ